MQPNTMFNQRTMGSGPGIGQMNMGQTGMGQMVQMPMGQMGQMGMGQGLMGMGQGLMGMGQGQIGMGQGQMAMGQGQMAMGQGQMGQTVVMGGQGQMSQTDQITKFNIPSKLYFPVIPSGVLSADNNMKHYRLSNIQNQTMRAAFNDIYGRI